MLRYCWLLGLCVAFTVNAVKASESVQIDKVYVVKSKRQLHLLHKSQVVKSYDIGLGHQPLGHKQHEGDSRTPEGKYLIDYRNPASQFHLSLHINYPNKADRKRAQSKGQSPGGEIFIHGLPNGVDDNESLYRHRDWTDGCIAVSNSAIKEIWRRVKNGTPIEIVP